MITLEFYNIIYNYYLSNKSEVLKMYLLLLKIYLKYKSNDIASIFNKYYLPNDNFKTLLAKYDKKSLIVVSNDTIIANIFAEIYNKPNGLLLQSLYKLLFNDDNINRKKIKINRFIEMH